MGVLSRLKGTKAWLFSQGVYKNPTRPVYLLSCFFLLDDLGVWPMFRSMS